MKPILEARTTSFLLFAVILEIFRAALAHQTFDQEPVYTEVNPGGEATLQCRIYQKRGGCSWQKDGKPVGIYKNKYEWAGNPDLGDCSLRVLNADLDFDDGDWECQVTASTYQSKDALTSRPARLVVRVPPQTPIIEFNGIQILSGRNLSTSEGAPTSVKCVSRYGNPAAQIRWFIGKRDITVAHSRQMNASELDTEKKWRAESVLNYTFGREHHLKRLKCVAQHEAYEPSRSREVQATLDVQYSPVISVDGVPTDDIEEGDSVLLRCLVQANPPAKVIWKKLGRSDYYNFEPELSFKRIARENSGNYVCEAQNELGKARGNSVEVDVKYKPRITSIGPSVNVTASAFESTSFSCEAEGNPPPKFKWLQRADVRSEAAYERGDRSQLVIQNVTYEHQGLYVCQAINVIKGNEQKGQSDTISLEVQGAPQVLPQATEEEVSVNKGDDARLVVTFCSDPPPQRSFWQWGSLALNVGDSNGKYQARKLLKNYRKDCYEAHLIVEGADLEDQRFYHLQIENERGKDGVAVELLVKEPVAMTTVAGVIIGCLVILVFLVMVVLYAFKSERWCFSEKDFKPSDANGGLEKQKGGFGNQNGGTGGAIPPDALYNPSLKSPIIGSEMDYDNNSAKNNGHNPARMRSPTDIIYADLQIPRSSNNGSMRIDRPQPPPRTEYAAIQFNPSGVRERADV